MIIVLKPNTTEDQARQILDRIEAAGLKPLYMPGSERTVLGALGDERVLGKLHLESYPQVDEVVPILTPYKMVSRELQPDDTVVQLGRWTVGGGSFTVIAGPCAVESHPQMTTAAHIVKRLGAHGLRGGAYKPRTSPYSFRGLELEGLKILQQAGREVDLPTVTEVVEVADVEAVAEYADAFQVGARNMQNFRLLTALGHRHKPVILKRGMAATVDDLLQAAEYIVSEGNPDVILCERGIRTFETATRNTLDLNAIPYLKAHTHLPVLVDPSHGTGVRDYVLPMARAAAACGADGVLVEVHPDPAEALSDGRQSLDEAGFETFMNELRPIVEVVGKTMG
ncbi:MAG: 3-deoxy-7-phosphoheptulonate synthase [Planctomycetota bacterium]